MTYILDLPAHQDNALPNVVSAIMVVQSHCNFQPSVLALLAQQHVREVIIVNASAFALCAANLAEFARAHPKCHVVPCAANAGLVAAYNQGIQYATCQFLLFVAQGCILPLQTVSKMLLTGAYKPGPWMVSVGNKDMKPTAEVSLLGGGRHVPFVCPQCFLVPTKVFLALDGFDPHCFHSTFHLDLSMRVHLAGGGVYAINEMQESDAKPKSLREKWQALKGWVHYYRKYLGNQTKIARWFQFTADLVKHSFR